jgi:23S rRNA (cytidine1920-2'-O)/16S rRNA (cytidine1409-2'-O)-methyltransferase
VSASRRPSSFVSRGGDKLAFALDHFAVTGVDRVCADLGCNVGGFTDCLLQRGANRVYAVDTGYGELAWTLRKDERVVVMERTNALHVSLPELVSLVTIDVAWTRQHLILPRAIALLQEPGVILSLIKPHYESPPDRLRRGVLPDESRDRTMAELNERMKTAGLQFDAIVDSPLRGGGGNHEFWGLLRHGGE